MKKNPIEQIARIKADIALNEGVIAFQEFNITRSRGVIAIRKEKNRRFLVTLQKLEASINLQKGPK